MAVVGDCLFRLGRRVWALLCSITVRLFRKLNCSSWKAYPSLLLLTILSFISINTAHAIQNIWSNNLTNGQWYGTIGDASTSQRSAYENYWNTSCSWGSLNADPKTVLSDPGVSEIRWQDPTGTCVGGYTGGGNLLHFERICWAGYDWVESSKWCELVGPPVKQKNLGKPKCPAGNPTNVGTGNKYQLESDGSGIGSGSFTFNRYYNSDANTESAYIGNNWRHEFDRQLVITGNGNTAHAFRPNGVVYKFVRSGGIWQSVDDDVTEILEDAEGGLRRLKSKNNLVEEYSREGFLLSIQDLRGLTFTLDYDIDERDRLVTVNTNTGESLTFAYNTNNRISSMTDNTGRTWGYRYDANSNLEYVDNPDTTTKQYHYEDPSFPNALTGITDERA